MSQVSSRDTWEECSTLFEKYVSELFSIVFQCLLKMLQYDNVNIMAMEFSDLCLPFSDIQDSLVYMFFYKEKKCGHCFMPPRRHHKVQCCKVYSSMGNMVWAYENKFPIVSIIIYIYQYCRFLHYKHLRMFHGRYSHLPNRSAGPNRSVGTQRSGNAQTYRPE